LGNCHVRSIRKWKLRLVKIEERLGKKVVQKSLERSEPEGNCKVVPGVKDVLRKREEPETANEREAASQDSRLGSEEELSRGGGEKRS